MAKRMSRTVFLAYRTNPVVRGVRCGFALAIAVVVAAASVLLPNVSVGPAAIVGIFAVLVGALLGGALVGWMCLAITCFGLRAAIVQTSLPATFDGRLLLWCTYLALGVAMVEVIRRMQTERRKLLEHDQRLRLARRAARIWFWEWDLKQDVLRWSREDEHRPGRNEYREMTVAEYLASRVYPEDRERVRNGLFDEVQRQERVELEYRVIDEDNTVHWLAVKGRLFHEDGVRTMLGMASEITSQKQADEMRSHFRAVLGSLAEGVCYVNTAGEIQYLNPAAEQMLGYSARQARGRDLHGLIHLQCELSEAQCCLFAAMKSRTPCEVREETFHTAAGASLIAEYTVAPVTSDGTTLGAVMLFRDISERKQAEAALRSSEKMAATGRLAATISHELRNPLDSVIQLLWLSRQNPALDPAVRQQLDLADQELHRMAELTQQTLAMHRQSASSVPVNIPKLLDGVTMLYGKKISAQKVRLSKRYDWQGEVPGFPAELRQVFTNLIVNAVEAMPAGGRLAIHVRRQRDLAGTRREGIAVYFADTGTGIPRAAARRIFEPFFTTKGEKGSGVGLWVSQGIVQRHGGSIRVHSNTRAGRSYTCFRIFLPDSPVAPELRVRNAGDSPTGAAASQPKAA
jgi:PAS domain S-box-containing protein